MNDAHQELAETLADLMDWAARPLESFPPYEFGAPLEGPLSIYGPVDAGNLRAAFGLRHKYFSETLRRAELAWESLPSELRRRIECEAILLRIERIVVAAKKRVTTQDEENLTKKTHSC